MITNDDWTQGLEGNNHAAGIIASDSTTQALMALVFEQRTANLIAFHQTAVGRRAMDTAALQEQILVRLGLEKSPQASE